MLVLAALWSVTAVAGDTGLVRQLVKAAAQGGLGCDPATAVATATHCICTGGRRCVGGGCVTGRHAANGSEVTGYRRGLCLGCRCQVIEPERRVAESNAPEWALCATEGNTCTCTGLVRYGSPGAWSVSIVDGNVSCSSTMLRRPPNYSGDEAHRVCQCRPGLPSGEVSLPATGGWGLQAEQRGRTRSVRLLVMTVATHREPFINLVEQSVSALGKEHLLHVVGLGGIFTGYGWKLKQVRDYLMRHRHRYDIVLFIDSFDTFIFSSAAEIVAKFLSFDAPMVVSGEVNIWPNPHLRNHMPSSSSTGHYKYPNSGTYIGRLNYVLELYSEAIAIQAKSICVDDQGELIKQLARDPKAFAIDHSAVLFQTTFGSARADLSVRDGRPYNAATGTAPCVVHANGWDKAPLLELINISGRFGPGQAAAAKNRMRLLEKRSTLQKRERAINNRCSVHNPNAALDPNDNLLERYGVQSKAQTLKARLEAAGLPWHQVEAQTWEIQEYLGFCPFLTPHDGKTALEGSNSIALPANFATDGFRVYIYPGPLDHFPAAYQAVIAAVKATPYVTLDPSEACVLVPDIDVSCWCESCLGRRRSSGLSPESKALSSELSKLRYWNNGKNHLLFEFSDAPCIPYEVDHAMVASVGLSTFHHRKRHDIGMPLFAMVEFNSSIRLVDSNARPLLLSFRGTRSPRSDQTRRHLWKLHNGHDVIVPCACRWFNAEQANPTGYDDRCGLDEKIFEKYTYTELLSRSKFSLIVEGFGYHSFRLTEVLAAGAIPVIAIDHYVLPFDELLDWDTFSVRVPEHMLLDIPDILRAIPDAVVQDMQRQAVKVYEQFFWSLGAQVATALEQVKLVHFTPPAEREQLRHSLIEDGLPYANRLSRTPNEVQTDSRYCNAPQHRQKKARDGAIMR